MSALNYSVEDLLVGKYYRSGSRNLDGIIQEAEKRSDVWYENAEAYRVRVRPTYEMGKIFKEDFWATVCVSQA